VKFASFMVCMKKGKMKFSSTFEKITSIVDVLYDPSLMKKMLSIGMIANMGNIVVFNSNKCLVIQNKDPNTIWQKVSGIRKMDCTNWRFILSSHLLKLWNHA
jgi:hypothetical protein